MANKPRVLFEDATYHITSRGNNRQTLFHDSFNFLFFLGFLSCSVYEYGWLCFSYCLMTNHYHLVIQTPQPNLSEGMHKLHSRYSHYYRNKYPFTGKLFEGRYDTQNISDDAYALESIRYDLINPVRAGLVKHPKDWSWSSYKETAGLEEPSGWVDNEWVRSMFDDDQIPAKRFMRFIEMGLE